ncbi:MAG: hypothetical protein AB1757_28295 [Acidobacteriota bacterium]
MVVAFFLFWKDRFPSCGRFINFDNKRRRRKVVAKIVNDPNTIIGIATGRFCSKLVRSGLRYEGVISLVTNEKMIPIPPSVIITAAADKNSDAHPTLATTGRGSSIGLVGDKLAPQRLQYCIPTVASTPQVEQNIVPRFPIQTYRLVGFLFIFQRDRLPYDYVYSRIQVAPN